MTDGGRRRSFDEPIEVNGCKPVTMRDARLSLFERLIVLGAMHPLQRANITAAEILLGLWLLPLVPERGTTNRFPSASEIIDRSNGAFYQRR
jgi:hypothetical protein